MAQINEDPNLILEDIKIHLLKGVKDRDHGFHTPVFCNNCKDNTIESRLIVLRKFDVNNLKLNFHTDLRSKKISCIKANSQTAFVFYDPKIKMQLRMKTISTINHQNKVTLQVWNQTKLSSRKCYLTLKAPSSKTLIPEDGIPSHIIGINPSQEESEEGFKNFVVVENKILHIDWLHLSFQGHRRLFIDFINSPPKFQWLIP